MKARDGAATELLDEGITKLGIGASSSFSAGGAGSCGSTTQKVSDGMERGRHHGRTNLLAIDCQKVFCFVKLGSELIRGELSKCS